jgi:hypothetical protein
MLADTQAMAQHFLLTAAARTLTLASVARMSDEQAERVFVRLRWSDNNGDAYRPHCGCLTAMPAAGRTARHAGAAKPAARISA